MDAYRDTRLTAEARAKDLLGRMTLREKVGQLNQRLYGFRVYETSGDELRLTQEFQDEVARWGGLGVLYGLHRADPWSGRDHETGLSGPLAVKARNAVQRYVIEHSRLGIPALITSECPHGPQILDGYLLPVNLAVGCSFSPELFEKAAAVGARQLRELGVDIALVSALDILRDPRWGRSEECYGEDPYLASAMAAAAIRGIHSQGLDVVAKHLCAQGETTGGVNASAARIGPRELREIHLPVVKAAVQAGVAGLMAAYNEIDGVFCHANRWLLTDLLRGEYGFDGFVMADGCAIDHLNAVTGSPAASAALALNAGVDVSLWDDGFTHLEQALAQGLISEERLNEAVLRVLTVKFRRGLFEHPYLPESDRWLRHTPENDPQVKALAEHTPVLLKNRGGLLPLDSTKPLRIGLIGPNADAPYNQLGDYTPPIRPGACVTLRMGLERLLRGSPVKLFYAPGCGMFDDRMDEAAVLAFAEQCDILIAAVGGTSSRFQGGVFAANGALEAQAGLTMDCGENVDDGRLELPGGQLRLLDTLRRSGKRIVTVLMGGRPYAMERIDQCSDALFCSFYPGLTGGEALAGLLLGRCEPAGRLSVSLPDTAGQLPVYYNAKASYGPMTYYNATPPRYVFGCGLSYTSFSYRLMEGPRENPAVTFAVTNIGSRPGWAVPQLYLKRLTGAVTARVRELWGFEKCLLQPGETKRLAIPIPPEALNQWDADMVYRPVPGAFHWFLCDGGETRLEGEFSI